MSIQDIDETTTISIEQEEYQNRPTRPRQRRNIQKDLNLFNLKVKLEEKKIDLEQYSVSLRHTSYSYLKKLDKQINK